MRDEPPYRDHTVSCGQRFDGWADRAESGTVPYVYMLRCRDGSYYVGSTRDLSRRLWEHQEGFGATYTRHRRPVELVWHAERENVGEAFFMEKRIQGWSRAKREALIRGDFGALAALAKKDFTKRTRRPD